MFFLREGGGSPQKQRDPFWSKHEAGGSFSHLLWKLVRPPRSDGFLFKGFANLLTKGWQKDPHFIYFLGKTSFRKKKQERENKTTFLVLFFWPGGPLKNFWRKTSGFFLPKRFSPEKEESPILAPRGEVLAPAASEAAGAAVVAADPGPRQRLGARRGGAGHGGVGQSHVEGGHCVPPGPGFNFTVLGMFFGFLAFLVLFIFTGGLQKQRFFGYHTKSRDVKFEEETAGGFLRIVVVGFGFLMVQGPCLFVFVLGFVY